MRGRVVAGLRLGLHPEHAEHGQLGIAGIAAEALGGLVGPQLAEAVGPDGAGLGDTDHRHDCTVQTASTSALVVPQHSMASLATLFGGSDVGLVP